MALLIGVDRFMSEARAITNIIGNSVATIVIAKSEKQFNPNPRRQICLLQTGSAEEVLAVKITDNLLKEW